MKSPDLKYIPWFHGLENNSNLFPPVIPYVRSDSQLINFSLRVVRDSAAFVWNAEGQLEFLPNGSGSRVAGRLDWSPREQCSLTYTGAGSTYSIPIITALPYSKPESPDILIEPASTNYATDRIASYSAQGSNMRIVQNSDNSTTIAFDGLIDPMGRQFAQGVYSVGSETGGSSGYYSYSLGSGSIFAKGFSQSIYVKNSRTIFYSTNNSDNQQGGCETIFIRAVDNLGKSYGVKFNFATKELEQIGLDGMSLNSASRIFVQTCRNGWYRIGYDVDDALETGNFSSPTFHFGFWDDNTNLPGVASSGGASAMFFGHQFEISNTQRIHTSLMYNQTTGSVTRSRESIGNPNDSNLSAALFNQCTEGAIFH